MDRNIGVYLIQWHAVVNVLIDMRSIHIITYTDHSSLKNIPLAMTSVKGYSTSTQLLA